MTFIHRHYQPEAGNTGRVDANRQDKGAKPIGCAISIPVVDTLFAILFGLRITSDDLKMPGPT